MHRLIQTVLFILSISIVGSAQQRCQMEAYIQQRFRSNPDLEKEFLERQSRFFEELNQRISCTSADEVAVPLAFHFDSDVTCADEACVLTAIQDQIEMMNIAYGDNSSSPNAANCPEAYPAISSGTCISFYLAEPPACADLTTTACNAAITIGEFNRGGYANGGSGAGSCWDDYLNVFVLTNFNGLGVADQIPDDIPPSGPGEGVTVISTAFGGLNGPCGPFNTFTRFGEGKTLVHEVGHYLGLFHTFQGGCSDEPNNTFNGVSINVDDTPAQSVDFGGCTSGCESSGCASAPYQQTANFMNYTDDACMDMFSEDQAFAQNLVALSLFGSLSIPAADISSGELFGLCPAEQCQIVCPSVVSTPISIIDSYCNHSGPVVLSANGVVVDGALEAVYLWSTGDYLSNGGSLLALDTINPIITTQCVVTSQVYYLNVDCNSLPLSTTLDAGTYTVSVYPGPPVDLMSLITVSGENTCDEPMIMPIAGCEGFIDILADSINPSFPVDAGETGVAAYTVSYIPDPAGPDCCFENVADDVVTNGDFENGNDSWTEVVEAPVGNPINLGVIGTSGGVLNGSNDAWFGGLGVRTGGSSVSSSFKSISQQVTIPSTCSSAILSFDYQAFCDGNATINVDVIISGITVGSFDCTDGAGSFSLDVLASGITPGMHTLVFEGTEDDPKPKNNDDSGNFYIDNIMLTSSGCPGSNCELIIAATYDCNCPTCYTNLTHDTACDLQTVETGVIEYESSDWISTGANTIIQNGAEVSYNATDYIEINGSLDHTFEVELGSIFHAFIDGCGGNVIHRIEDFKK